MRGALRIVLQDLSPFSSARPRTRPVLDCHRAAGRRVRLRTSQRSPSTRIRPEPLIGSRAGSSSCSPSSITVANVAPIAFVSIGDSFSSGEAAPLYSAGSTLWLVQGRKRRTSTHWERANTPEPRTHHLSSRKASSTPPPTSSRSRSVATMSGSPRSYAAASFSPNCFSREAYDTGLTWSEYLPLHISATVKPAVRALYEEIRALAPSAAVIALGYPR